MRSSAETPSDRSRGSSVVDVGAADADAAAAAAPIFGKFATVVGTRTGSVAFVAPSMRSPVAISLAASDGNSRASGSASVRSRGGVSAYDSAAGDSSSVPVKIPSPSVTEAKASLT